MPDRDASDSPWAALVERIDDPLALRLAVEALWTALDAPAEAGQVLGNLKRSLRAEWLGVVRRAEAGWQITAATGAPPDLPADLLGDVLDQGQTLVRQPWTAAMLASPGASSQDLLLIRSGTKQPIPARFPLTELALLIGRALQSARDIVDAAARAEYLQDILDASRQWHQTVQLEPLLVQIAESASRLLNADRASIFLWDRPRKLLIGRPALGVPGGELRVPDDIGVVGAVLKSGQPLRAGPAHSPERISHQIDAQTGYRTESVLCVPLRAVDGQLLGVFEVMNKRTGQFLEGDEAVLSELARHAAVSLANTQERVSLIKSRQEVASEAARRIQFIGRSQAIENLRSMIPQAAMSDLAVLVLGENGTGKEVLSQAIHYHSRRRQEPLVAVNCAALSESLLESELFGHEQGAFTDAKQARPGKFESASGGTLFLDEIGELSRGGQAKLLRVLEDKTVVRVGGVKPINTDTRVIAATNRDLLEMVRRKEFREDLYYRLNVISLQLPPLRDRGDDVLELAEHFLVEFARKAGRVPQQLTAGARSKLLQHLWPGNVRELRNLIERLAHLLPTQEIQAQDVTFAVSAETRPPRGINDDLTLAAAVDAFEAEYIHAALQRCRGSMTDAAKQLGLHRANLYRKMKTLGLDPPGD